MLSIPPKRVLTTTIAEVRDRILADETLVRLKRTNAALALGSLAKAFGLPAEQVVADPKAIGNVLKKVAAAELGLANNTWRTRQSLIRFALRHAGILAGNPRRTERFTPAWTEVMRLPQAQGELFALSRLARYCSVQAIDPEAVDDKAFDGFLSDMESCEVVKGARKVHRRAAMTWNHLANTTRGWPSQLVEVPSYSRRYAIPWSEFPSTLKADIDAHLASLDGSDPANLLRVRPLKPRSIATRLHQLHVLVTGMGIKGEDKSQFKTLADIVQPDKVRIGLRFLLERVGGKKAQAHDVAWMAASVARHWVEAPEWQVTELSRMAKALTTPDGMTKFNRERLRQFDAPENVELIRRLPAVLVAEVVHSPNMPSKSEALKVQTALMVELLIKTCMRLGNLAALDTSRHFIRTKNGAVYLVIEEDEVKNESRIDVELERSTIKLLDLYTKIYRPMLADTPSAWLFPGRKGPPKCGRAVSDQICETIRIRTGLATHVHLFRHLAAKIYLEAHPGAYGVVQRMLGHKSIQTTIRIYAGTETRAAVSHYHKILLERSK